MIVHSVDIHTYADILNITNDFPDPCIDCAFLHKDTRVAVGTGLRP